MVLGTPGGLVFDPLLIEKGNLKYRLFILSLSINDDIPLCLKVSRSFFRSGSPTYHPQSSGLDKEVVDHTFPCSVTCEQCRNPEGVQVHFWGCYWIGQKEIPLFLELTFCFEETGKKDFSFSGLKSIPNFERYLKIIMLSAGAVAIADTLTTFVTLQGRYFRTKEESEDKFKIEYMEKKSEEKNGSNKVYP